MEMIKAIIFDVGGVLVRTEDRSRRDALEDRFGLARGESEQWVFNGELGIKAQLGEITTDALWAGIQQQLRLTSEEIAAFQHDFFVGDQMDTELVKLIRRLRGRYQTAIISNANDRLLHMLTHDYPMADAFDLIVGSAYEKVMKPDAVIFERTLERLNCQAGEAVFIDDFMHNIVGAQAVGMNGIHFTPDIDLPKTLLDLGIHIDD